MGEWLRGGLVNGEGLLLNGGGLRRDLGDLLLLELLEGLFNGLGLRLL